MEGVVPIHHIRAFWESVFEALFRTLFFGQFHNFSLKYRYSQKFRNRQFRSISELLTVLIIETAVYTRFRAFLFCGFDSII